MAFLRALGGISNIVDVAEDGAWLYIQVASHDHVSVTTLNSMLPEKVLIDRINKLYLCEVGEQSHFLHQRLSKLISNPFGETEFEVQISTPFNIHPMDYEHRVAAAAAAAAASAAAKASAAPESDAAVSAVTDTQMQSLLGSASNSAASSAQAAG